MNVNIPFPRIYPRLIDVKWFNPDSPCDEDAELTALEQAHQTKMNSIGQQFTEIQPCGKILLQRMYDEADTDDDANLDSDESEESNDEDEIDIESSQGDDNEMDVNNVEELDSDSSVEVVEDFDSQEVSVVYSSP